MQGSKVSSVCKLINECRTFILIPRKAPALQNVVDHIEDEVLSRHEVGKIVLDHKQYDSQFMNASSVAVLLMRFTCGTLLANTIEVTVEKLL